MSNYKIMSNIQMHIKISDKNAKVGNIAYFRGL